MFYGGKIKLHYSSSSDIIWDIVIENLSVHLNELKFNLSTLSFRYHFSIDLFFYLNECLLIHLL